MALPNKLSCISLNDEDNELSSQRLKEVFTEQINLASGIAVLNEDLFDHSSLTYT